MLNRDQIVFLTLKNNFGTKKHPWVNGFIKEMWTKQAFSTKVKNTISKEVMSLVIFLLTKVEIILETYLS